MFDVNVLVAAIKGGDHPTDLGHHHRLAAPRTPTASVINDAAEFALWRSPHIISNVARVLSEVLGLDGKHIDDYIHVLTDLASASGGGLTDRPRRPWVTARTGKTAGSSTWPRRWAWVIVSLDNDLLEMSPWRGRPIAEGQFASLVDASGRVRRRTR